MESIKLPHDIWHYDPTKPLGPKGGFGIVYAGFSEKFGNLAIKQILLDAQDAIQREFRIADELKGADFDHVIPFYDAGQDSETGVNYVVMARAEKSLQQEIKNGRIFTDVETIEILHQIVKGLLEVPELVHRDLKPGNILLHEGKWKVADFGIAKFVEESTSLHTLKNCLSPLYAAPEQWEYLRPTHAIDVYALGCIGFTLLTGRPPFSGTSEELKQHHLHSEPPTLNLSNALLLSLLSMMLRKTPETRPSLERVKNLLEQMSSQNSKSGLGGFKALSNAAAEVSAQSAKEEARRLTEQDEQKRRERIAREAQEILWQIIDTLFERIAAYAPNATILPARDHLKQHLPYPDRSIQLGTATLTVIFSRFSVLPENAFSQCKWDVFTGTIIKVEQKTAKPYEWSANLWFTDLGKGFEYRWWEVTYMTSWVSHNPRYEPYALEDLSVADRAAAPVMDVIQLGARPKLVDDEAIDEFCNRWAELLAKAAKGELTRPSHLPLD